MYFWKLGLNYKELSNNPDIISDILDSIYDTNMYKSILNQIISLNLPTTFYKNLYTLLLNNLQNELDTSYNGYDNEKVIECSKKLKMIVLDLKVSDEDRLSYIENNFNNLAKNPLFLASLYGYFNVYKQNQMEHPFQIFFNKEMKTRFDYLNKKVFETVKEYDYPRKLIECTQPAQSKSIDIDIGNDIELKEKISILSSFNNLSVANFLKNNKTLLKSLSIEQISRISLDNSLISNINILTYDSKRQFVFQEFLKKPNIRDELLDFILGLSNYGILFKNTSFEEIQKSENLNKLIDLIVLDRFNSYNIESLQQLHNYTKIRAEKCLSILKGNTIKISSLEEFMQIDSIPKNSIAQKKEAIYKLFFGFNAEQVENLVKKYGEDVFKPEMTSESMTSKDLKALEIIRSLRYLYQLKDVDKICEGILSDPDLIERLKTEDICISYSSLENSLIELYTNKLNNALYNPVKGHHIRETTYNGQPSEIQKNNLLSKLPIFKKNDKIINYKGRIGYTSSLLGVKTTYLFPNDTAKGKKVRVYELDPTNPFYILGRVEGAYAGIYQEPYDYSTDKNFNLSYHGNCKSLIANDLLSLARSSENSGPIFGYSFQDNNGLLMMAPWDISSISTSYASHRMPWNYRRGIQFRLPKFMKNFTRHNHNELVSDRLMYDENLKDFKMDKPQYVIYLKDFDENTIINDDRWLFLSKKYKLNKKTLIDKRLDILKNLSNQTGIPLEELIYDDKYRQSVKAAAQFDIPLVILDREKIIQNEYDLMKNKLNEFIKTDNPDVIAKYIPDLIVSFENNCNSLRFASSKLRDTMFTDSDRIKMFNIIKMKISNADHSKEFLENIFENTLIEERKKTISNSGIILRSQLPRSIIDELKRIDEKRSKKFSEIELPKMIKAISQTDFYNGNKHHSIEHIHKVMIFADKIASSKKYSVEEKRILIAAAAFHDSGRGKDNDGNDAHGVASAMKVQEYFESHPNNPFGITEENLPLIQAAIEYHEINDRNKYKSRNILKKLQKKYNISEKKGSAGNILRPNDSEFDFFRDFANILKDADALDRYRFAHHGRLNPDFLRTKQAKSLLDFANVLNAKYASAILEEIYHATPEELKNHRKVSSLTFFRKKRITENPDYIEPHIDVNSLLTNVYGFSIPNEEQEPKSDENLVSFFKKKSDFALYEDLTPMDIKTFMNHLSKSFNIMRDKKSIEEELE